MYIVSSHIAQSRTLKYVREYLHVLVGNKSNESVNNFIFFYLSFVVVWHPVYTRAFK